MRGDDDAGDSGGPGRDLRGGMVPQEVRGWRSRPLEVVYPMDCLGVPSGKIRDSGHIRNKVICVLTGVNLDGCKELLGLWMAQSVLENICDPRGLSLKDSLEILAKSVEDWQGLNRQSDDIPGLAFEFQP